MATFSPFGAKTYYLNGSISSTATSITLSSFTEPVSGVAYTMALLNTDIVYGTISPKTSSSEFISFTGITQNADGTATLTGVTRGLAKKSPFTTSSTFKLPHSGQSQFIISNPPQLYNEYVTLDNAETIEGIKTFNAFPVSGAGLPVSGTQFATKQYVDNTATGTTNVNRIIVAGTAGETLAVDQLVYLKASDGRWWLADADSAASSENVILGIAQGAGTAGAAITNGVLTQGLNTFSSLTLTANTQYYVSNTAGGFSSTPGTKEVSVGESQTTTTFLFYPRNDQQITEDQQDALAGTSGTPSSTNKYVTNDDTATAATADKIARRLAGGNITVVTETAGTSSTNAASTAFVGTAIAANTQIQQQLDLITGTDTGYTSNFAVTMNTAGTILVVSCLLSTQFVKTFRFARDTTTGIFVMTAAGSFTTVTGTLSNGCVMIAGSYVYAAYIDNGVSKLTRFDLADLANSTAMTYSGTAPSTVNGGHSDGTDLYIYTATTNYYRYTISGTTATNAATISYTGFTGPSFGSTSDGTSVWTSNDSGAGSVTILKYPLAGGASTGSATYMFNYDIYPNSSGIRFFNYKSGVLGIAQANTIASAAAVTGTEVRILGITTP